MAASLSPQNFWNRLPNCFSCMTVTRPSGIPYCWRRILYRDGIKKGVQTTRTEVKGTTKTSITQKGAIFSLEV